MFKLKLVLYLMILLVTAGCQQVYNNTSANSYNKAQTPSLETQKPVDLSVLTTSDNKNKRDITLKKANNTKEAGTISEPVLPAPDKKRLLADGIEKESDKQGQVLELTGQEKIDQALELCDYAQQMWEKGNIEEALTSLDSAYSNILEIDTEIFSELNQQKEDIRYLISKRILEIYASRQIVANGQWTTQ